MASKPHHIGRRLWREYVREAQFRRDDDSLIADFKPLLSRAESVPTDRGCWLSAIIPSKGHGRVFTLRDVRTFVMI